MEKDWVDVVIPVIMIGLSVVGLVSKKKQQQRKLQERRARVLREFMVEDPDPEPDPESGFGFEPGPEEEAAVPPPVQPFTDPQQEGQCAVDHASPQPVAPEDKPRKIDPEKLIIYAEIMKPKFDEGLDKF